MKSFYSAKDIYGTDYNDTSQYTVLFKEEKCIVNKISLI